MEVNWKNINQTLVVGLRPDHSLLGTPKICAKNDLSPLKFINKIKSKTKLATLYLAKPTTCQPYNLPTLQLANPTTCQPNQKPTTCQPRQKPTTCQPYNLPTKLKIYNLPTCL